MNEPHLLEQIGVCSWSLQPSSAAELVQGVLATGIRKVQVALDPIRENPSAWSELPSLVAQHQLSLVSGMFVTAGEDYSSMESIRRTGGLVPDETWTQNWENAPGNVAVARQLGLKLVTFHAGFIPHQPSDPAFDKLIHRIRLVADLYAAQGIELAFETGQETAPDLNRFLAVLGRQHVGVNFDPANMLLYDKGDPIEALRVLAPWLRQCHLKDAIKTRQPGTWGEEVPVGTGQVDWVAFFEVLRELGFRGPLCFEREAGAKRVQDIRGGLEFVTRVLKANEL